MEEVRVDDGVDEVESDVEPQDDHNGLLDSDESDFAQDVADASEDITSTTSSPGIRTPLYRVRAL